MRTNSHRQALHDELQQLVQRSIACRRQLEAIASGVRFGGDQLDTEQLRQKLHAELAYLGKAKARLRFDLGLPEPIGSIKLSAPVPAKKKSTAVWLDAPVPPQKSPAARLNEAKRTRGYLTRDLTRR